MNRALYLKIVYIPCKISLILAISKRPIKQVFIRQLISQIFKFELVCFLSLPKPVSGSSCALCNSMKTAVIIVRQGLYGSKLVWFWLLLVRRILKNNIEYRKFCSSAGWHCYP